MQIFNISTLKLNIRNLQPNDLTDFYIYRSNPTTHSPIILHSTETIGSENKKEFI
jgi:hypothetical protein